MKAEIAFRPLAAADLQQMFLWLGRPHVTKWYASAPTSFAEVSAKYGPRTEAGNPVRAFIFTVNGADAGYIQTYAIAEFPDYASQLECGPGTAGMDLFVGDAWRTSHGVGSAAVRRFVDEVVFADAAVLCCVAGPNEGNAASIRAFEKAGFTRWKTVRPEGAEPECVLRRDRGESLPRIEPIDLDRDAATCIGFRRDAFVASFGSEDGIDEEMGASGEVYLAQLRGRIAQLPAGNAHVWHGERIVGQTEMRLIEGEPRVGYVNLFYLVPEFRGRGFGRALHDHAVRVFTPLGCGVLRLSVSERNAAAIAFYTRLGWVAVGTRPHRETMQVMEFPL